MQAVLWDMDGTLVDTEPYWIECEFAMAAKYGGEWSDADAMQMVGNNLVDSGRYMKKRWGVDLTPEEIVEELLDGVVEMVQSDVPWRPGARRAGGRDEALCLRAPIATSTHAHTEGAR